MSAATTLEALQTTLAAEHAALWVHALLGGQASRFGDGGLRRRVESAYEVHRSRRDQLARWIRDLGVEPVPSEVGYALPGGTATATRVTETARRVEQRVTAVYADLVASTVTDQRRWAISALTDAAVRELGFRGSPESFPGLPELADR